MDTGEIGVTLRSAVFEAMRGWEQDGVVKIVARSAALVLGCSDTSLSAALRWLTSSGWIVAIRPVSKQEGGEYRIVPRAARKQTPRALAAMVSDIWPLERLDLLVSLFEEGHSMNVIASRLGCTKNAVVGKSHRLNEAGLLGSRPSPIIRDGDTLPARIIRAIGATLPPLPSLASSPVMAVPRAPDARPRETRAIRAPRPPSIFGGVAARPMPVPSVEDKPYVPKGGCRWPTWGSGTPTHVYCDRPIERRAYCEAHAKVCYVRHYARADDDFNTPLNVGGIASRHIPA